MGEAAATGPSTALGEAELVAEARAKAGLDDFGDESFREPMRRLLHSLDSEAGLNAIGRMTQHARIVDSLVTRLVTEDSIRRRPEILDESIEAPFVVVGLARTGTTMLHRLLASDPGLNAALWWECRNPAPFPGSDWRRDDPRIDAARAEVQMILDTQPVLASIHPWDAEGPDEEIMLFEHSFLSHVPESGANLPSYRAWLEEQDVRPGYALMKRLLQFLQWQKKQAGRAGERWVLKAPFHLNYMELLFETFPDARVVQTHRDPLETIPSVASMYHSLWGLAADQPDPLEVGRQVSERWSRALHRCLEQRAKLGEERFLDVWYRDVLADPLAQVRRIYEFVGRSLEPAADAAMRAWLERNARDKRAAHSYESATFGLTPEGIERDFAAYRERFIR